jgi:hypothetical protein
MTLVQIGSIPSGPMFLCDLTWQLHQWYVAAYVEFTIQFGTLAENESRPPDTQKARQLAWDTIVTYGKWYRQLVTTVRERQLVHAYNTYTILYGRQGTDGELQ